MSATAPELPRLDALLGGITAEVGRTLHALAAEVPAGQAIVEIGSYLGKSTSYLAVGAGNDVSVFAVDPWESVAPSRWFRLRRHPPPSLTGFTTQLRSVGLVDRVTAIQGLSVDVAKTYHGPPVGLLFVDGDHHAGAAGADFHAWRPHLAAEATIAFDDYGVTRNPEVAESVRRLGRLFDGPIITACDGRLAIAQWRMA